MSPPPPDTVKYRWLLTICLAEVGTMLVFFNYSAVLPSLQAEWHLSNTGAGLVHSAYHIGYIALVVVLSALTDYVGPKRVYVGSALWAGLANLLFPSTPGTWPRRPSCAP